MKDKNKNIIYIGKSISLKKRVKSYFYNQKKSKKIEKMVFLICDIDYIVTQTNLEAKLEECRLIKKYKPIFNVQYKNDYRYYFLNIDISNKEILSISKEQKGKSLALFRNKNTALEFINLFEHLYPILKYEDIYEFEYNILSKKLNTEELKITTLNVKEILLNKDNLDKFIERLIIKRDKASSKLKFEIAGFYNELLKKMNIIKRFNLIESVFNQRHIVLRMDIGFKSMYFRIYNGKIINKSSNLNQISNNINININEEKFIIDRNNYDYLKILLYEMQNKDNLVLYL